MFQVLISLIYDSVDNNLLMHFTGTPSSIQQSSNSTVWPGPVSSITGLSSRIIELSTEKVINACIRKTIFYRFLFVC